jgi:hypothetical protein
MPMKQKAKSKKALARPFVMTIVAVGVPTAVVASGCGTSKPGATGGEGIAPQPTLGGDDGTCTTEGATRACHKTVGQNGPYISCFEGTQTCAGGLWSDCGGTGTLSNRIGQLGLKPAGVAGAGNIHTLASSACGDGNCNGPTCKGGTNAGKSCTSNLDCLIGGICGRGKCSGGSNNNGWCFSTLECPVGKPCNAVTEDCSNCPTDCGYCAPGSADAGANICATDPCATGCNGWSNTQSVGVGDGGTSTVIGVTGFGQIPYGQLKKLENDSCNGGADCDNHSSTGPSSFYNCQLDTYCSLSQAGGDGCCHQFPPNATQATDTSGMGTVAGVDITIGPGCSNVERDEYRYFPVCNRGGTATAPGVNIYVKWTNPIQPFTMCPPVAGNPNYCTAATADCFVTTDATTGLLPGQCILMDTEATGCTGQPSGEKWGFINCDNSIAEDVMTSSAAAQAAPDSEPVTSLGCANNWTDHSGANNPPACSTTGAGITNYQLTFHATCPPGYNVNWREFQYNSTVPNNGSGTAEVVFSAATAPDSGGEAGTFSQAVTIAEARSNSATTKSDPEDCTTTPTTVATCTNAAATTGAIQTGPTPPCCPKDILAQFQRPVTGPPTTPNLFPGFGVANGLANDQNPWLQLNIQLKTTPDGKGLPTADGFQLSYQCVSNE